MWRSRILWRLFGVYGILLIVSFGVLGWLLTGRIEKHLLGEIQRSLEMKALLVGDLAAQGSELELQTKVKRVARETNTRITLIHADGKVLADSDEEPAKMENHGDRPELQDAQTSGLGVATRHSGTVRQPMMYVARRLEVGPVRYARVAVPLTAVASEIRWLHRVVWTATGLTLAAALVLSLLLAHRITAPLVELSNAADSIAHGEFGKKVLLSSSDEVGELAASFNAMSEACAAHIAQMAHDREQLRAIFRSMVEGVIVIDAERTVLFANDAASQLLGAPLEASAGQKIWQLFRHRQFHDAVDKVLDADKPYASEMEWIGPERRTYSMQGARLPGEPHRGAILVIHDVTHLRKLETVRQDFVANVSHELKTPLAVIQATVETLLDGAINDAEHNVRFLDRIRESAERLHRLVRDLLTLGRIESHQAQWELTYIPLQLAVEASVARHSDRARAKGLQLLMEPPPGSPAVVADEEALLEIIDNLVDNALKYTPAGGVITLRWFADGAHAVLQVADTGVGIPEKDLPRVFERFYRVDKARSRELGGTGLGLSIVKHLVQAFGGNISAASEVEQGSTFTVQLPLARESDMNGRCRVIFVCVENSNRSQMAEAFARIHGADRVDATSAGSRPSGVINPKAIEAMRELGYDLARHTSKGLSELTDGEFDIAVTMGCGDQCPNLRAKLREDWQIPDPREMPPDQFRAVRDLIEQKVQDLLRRIPAPAIA